MRKSLILVLTIAGGGVCYAAGVSKVGTDASVSDPSTWRWQVSSIIADQQSASARPAMTVGAVDARAFAQHYERYTPLGVPEQRKDDLPP